MKLTPQTTHIDTQVIPEEFWTLDPTECTELRHTFAPNYGINPRTRLTLNQLIPGQGIVVRGQTKGLINLQFQVGESSPLQSLENLPFELPWGSEFIVKRFRKPRTIGFYGPEMENNFHFPEQNRTLKFRLPHSLRMSIREFVQQHTPEIASYLDQRSKS
jgi:hypothetical protein